LNFSQSADRPGWFFAKLVIWLAISAFAGVVLRRKALAGPLGIITAILVALANAALARMPAEAMVHQDFGLSSGQQAGELVTAQSAGCFDKTGFH
jgi:hypothetical protein